MSKKKYPISENHVLIQQFRKQESLEKAYGVTLDELKTPSRKRIHADARNILTVLFCFHHNVHPESMAIYFNRHRTTGYNMLNAGINLVNADNAESLKKLFEHFENSSYYRSQCYSCQHKSNGFPGSALNSCSFYKEMFAQLKHGKLMSLSAQYSPELRKLMPQGEYHGIKNGWYNFPVNYDPVWMISKCKFYKCHG
jgi:hypothetical protein